MARVACETVVTNGTMSNYRGSLKHLYMHRVPGYWQRCDREIGILLGALFWGFDY